MNSLKTLKRLIIQGKESPLQKENPMPVGVKIPEIRESAYKIIKKRNKLCEITNEHSLTKKSPIRVPESSRNISPTEGPRRLLKATDNYTTHILTPECKIVDPKLCKLQLTDQQLEYLQCVVQSQRNHKQKALRDLEHLEKIYDKILLIKKSSISVPSNKSEQSQVDRSRNNSGHQTEVLSIPSSFQNSIKTNQDQDTDEKSRKGSVFFDDSSICQKNDIEFKKIMYILQSKSRALQIGTDNSTDQQRHLRHSGNMVTKPIGISSLGETRNLGKKSQLLEIVSMLNTKYKKNIQFN